MNISRKAIFLAGILLFCLPGLLRAQVRQTREEYIDRYKHIAVEQMERYGIPASITMAQGILESDCGNSLLSLRSNNHFGIKCKSNWRGGKVYHDDDAKGECFRAYPSVEASYFDHAEFLDSQPRYDSLFAYASDDYRSWARGLKAAGYATAPDYAQRLVRIIEESQLYLLDRPDGERLYAQRYGLSRDPEEWFSSQSSLERPAETSAVDPDNYRVTINAHEGYNVYATNGVHYVLAKADDTFEDIGRKFRISPRNLQRPEGQESAAPAGRDGLHRAQEEALGGQRPAPHLPRRRDGLLHRTVLRHPHAFDREAQPPQAGREARKKPADTHQVNTHTF